MAMMAKKVRHQGADPVSMLVREAEDSDVSGIQEDYLVWVARRNAEGVAISIRAVYNAGGGIDILPARCLRFQPEGKLRCKFAFKTRRQHGGTVKVGYAVPFDVEEAARLGFWKRASDNIIRVNFRQNFQKGQDGAQEPVKGWRWAISNGPFGKNVYADNDLDVEPYFGQDIYVLVEEKDSCFIAKEIVSVAEMEEQKKEKEAAAGAAETVRIAQNLTDEILEKVVETGNAVAQLGEVVEIEGVDPWLASLTSDAKDMFDICGEINLPKESTMAKLEERWAELEPEKKPANRIRDYRRDCGGAMPSEETQEDWNLEYARVYVAYNAFRRNITRRDAEERYAPLGVAELDRLGWGISKFSKFIKTTRLEGFAKLLDVLPKVIAEDLERAGYPLKKGADEGLSAKIRYKVAKIAIGMMVERREAEAANTQATD